MPLLPVAVEIAPPDAPRVQVAALINACSRAVAYTECVVATEATDERPSAVAIVTWQSQVRAVVEVGRLRDGQPEWRTRSLDFETADSAVERWRTVGFVVGTLARGETLSEEVARPPDERLQPTLPAPNAVLNSPPADAAAARGAAQRGTAAAQAALDLGAATGPAMNRFRTGALLRSYLPLYGPLRTFLGVRYLQLPTDDSGLKARWVTLGAGVGAITALRDVELSTALELRAESFHAQATSSFESDSASRWLAGTAVNASVAWLPLTRVGAFVSGDAAWMFGAATDIEVGLEQAAQDSAWRFTLEGGLRLRLW